MNIPPIKKEPALLPTNGSVVIIDDNQSEAMPILKALYRKGIATTYYQGFSKNDLPEIPSQIIRLAFLDLQLIDSGDPNTISKSVVSVLQRIIPQNNGPYLLVIWSKKYHMYGDSVKKEINSNPGIVPACILNFDKNLCIESFENKLVDEESLIEKMEELLTGRISDSEMSEVTDALKTALIGMRVMDYKEKADAVTTIENFIRNELQNAGCFHLFVIWENIVKGASAEIVNDISSLAPMNENWEVNIKNIFKRMGLARVGRNEVAMSVLIEESINTLNTSLVDSLENALKKEQLPEYIKLDDEVIFASKVGDQTYKIKGSPQHQFLKDENILEKNEKQEALKRALPKNAKISVDDKAVAKEMFRTYDTIPFKLNTRLHIELEPSQELIPGNIYHNPEKAKRDQYLKTFFKSLPEDTNDYKLIDLEVSPICDYAQDKWKRSRTLPGVLYPANDRLSLKSDNASYCYHVEPTFAIEDKEYRLLFDFHLFNAFDKTTAKERKVIYRLKRELLMDIIAQLSSHVNRPGISFIQ